MNYKTKNILKWTPSVIVALQLSVSAILKFTSVPFLVQSFNEIGLGDYLMLFGIAEILFVALFLFRRTMKIGFFLLTAYLGGAIATEITHGSFIAPVMILTLTWIAAYLRNPYLFKEDKLSAKQPVWQRKIAA